MLRLYEIFTKLVDPAQPGLKHSETPDKIETFQRAPERADPRGGILIKAHSDARPAAAAKSSWLLDKIMSWFRGGLGHGVIRIERNISWG